ncbi:hypothetical protein AB0F17_37580 [Nonomuraea sp. NPDC026600]|uniref:hypothetical protein n=1 Tax=Nonomuraea sp. NPDC026600 TaxID=3155363 RepID=UPI0033F02B5A
MAFKFFMNDKDGNEVVRGQSASPREAVNFLRDEASKIERNSPKIAANMRQAAGRIEKARRDRKLP